MSVTNITVLMMMAYVSWMRTHDVQWTPSHSSLT